MRVKPSLIEQDEGYIDSGFDHKETIEGHTP